MPELILASGSSRRRALLRAWGYAFRIAPSGISEDIRERNPRSLVRKLALLKGRAVAGRFPEDVVLSADLVIFFRGRIIGKPVSRAAARRTLALLSGRRHRIFCGVCAVSGGRARCRIASAEMELGRLSKSEIAEYVASGMPLDKAGSYGIQDPWLSGKFRIVGGARSTVIGLPRKETEGLLADAGIHPRKTPHSLN